MASLLMSKCSLPSPASRQYVEHMERKASWVIVEIYSPSTLQSNTLKKKRWKLTRRVLFTVKVDTLSFSSNWAPLDPTKQTVEQVQKIDMWGYFCNL